MRRRKEERKASRRGTQPQPQSTRREPVRAKRPATASPEPAPEPEPVKKKAKVDKPVADKPKTKKKKEIVLPQDDVDVEDREIAWLEYMLSKEKGEDIDGLDGESRQRCWLI